MGLDTTHDCWHGALPPKQREAAEYLLANDRVVPFTELHHALGHKSPGGMEYPNETALIDKGVAVRVVGPRGGSAIMHAVHFCRRQILGHRWAPLNGSIPEVSP